jgi:hypothetical protein
MSKSEANNDTPGSSKISRGEPSKQYTNLLQEARTTMTSELGMSGASMSRNMAATGRDDVLEEDRGARPHIILYSRQGLASSEDQLCSERYQAQRIWPLFV